MARKQTQGQCGACGVVLGRRAMTTHLARCGNNVAGDTAFHLLVQDAWTPDYWLHLEAPKTATLHALDQFLRAIWLECCGHLSAFTIKGRSYGVVRDLDMKSMKVALRDLLAVGMSFTHEYDFGSTTELTLKVMGERAAQGRDIRLLARNLPPDIRCDECGAPATHICPFCLDGEHGHLCDACADGHKCDEWSSEESLLPLVNSPRAGVCDYTGEDGAATF